MQIFPESIRSLWVEWEIRVLVLLSLLMQIFLIILGGRRKYSTNVFLNFTLWGIYLSADWLATMSLGNLASNQMGDSNNNSDTSKNQQKLLLHALWAPFLLLHLGGPDTITAYSLEDNSLWLRHLLGLIVQVSGAFYIFLLSLGNNALSLIAIPVFVSGVIKYLERTLALRAANPDQMRNSKEDEEDIPDNCDDDDELKHVHLGYHILPFAKNLYANRKVFRSYYDRHLMSTEVFKVIEAQLGFLFDELYTKASIIYTPQGLVLRLISVLSIVSALVAFHFIVIIDNSTNVDAVITYILFVGAVSLEIYAFASLILSDWTIRWVTKMNTHCPFANSLYSAISSCRRRCRIMFHEKRWSGNMGQLNLVDICLKETEDIGRESSYRVSFKFFNLFRIKGETMVDNDLKSCVYTELAMNNMLLFDHENDANKVVSERVQYLAEKTTSVYDQQNVPENNVFEIDESIIIWHVATTICYYSNDNNNNSNNDEEEETQKKREASKRVSDYLLYILLMRPSMLSDRIERIEVITNNFNYAIRLFHQDEDTIENISDACKLLREEKSNHFDPGFVMRSAGELASKLEEENDDEKLWDQIWEAWVVMLTYSAYHCEWISHAQQLANGGEFLTHISLLLAINGLTDKFLS